MADFDNRDASDTVTGTDGNDTFRLHDDFAPISSADENDILNIGGGDDLVTLGPGRDTIDGGDGAGDTLSTVSFDTSGPFASEEYPVYAASLTVDLKAETYSVNWLGMDLGYTDFTLPKFSSSGEVRRFTPADWMFLHGVALTGFRTIPWAAARWGLRFDFWRSARPQASDWGHRVRHSAGFWGDGTFGKQL